MKWLRKNQWKWILDLGMALGLALLYNKQVFGLAFHEIAGLALGGLFILHKLLNGRWIKAVAKGLFSRTVPLRQKLFWGLDALLLLSFGYVLVSGILISKIVFPAFGGNKAFTAGHYAAAALALALTGVHVGLHWGWIRQRLPLVKKLPLVARRILAVTLSVAVLALGGVQLANTAFLQWIGNVGSIFSTPQAEGGGNGNGWRGGAGAQSTETIAADGTVTEAQTGRQGHNGSGLGGGQGLHRQEGAAGSQDVGSVLLQYLSLLFSFAVVTAWLDGFWNNRRRSRARRLATGDAVTA
ncbi:MAG: DUF4405 domain-containing protein [Candidatus Limiplasma sp.]|nr:DUF4405 domain-containing protein [Candidatus Limiplasma sp.]